ncbi:MAG: NPCBM/NEW2 domain-containing protein [Streptosporangiaceae bacterium]
MTDQPKVPHDDSSCPRKGSTAEGNHEGPNSPEKAVLAQRCATIGSRAGQHAAARHRRIAVLLCLALSGALVACSSGSHSPNAPSAVKPASGPALTGSPAAPASTGSPSAPASTGSATAPASPSSSPALATSIEDLQTTPDSEPYDTQGVAEVNGVSYPDSLGAQFCFGSNERKWTYVLGRKYSSLQGTIGLSDNSVSTAQIRFEILADGRLVYSKDLQVGQSAALNVPVSNVLQLELDTILLTQAGGCGDATGEWADIQVAGP